MHLYAGADNMEWRTCMMYTYDLPWLLDLGLIT